jgi:hypothetical protein
MSLVYIAALAWSKADPDVSRENGQHVTKGLKLAWKGLKQSTIYRTETLLTLLKHGLKV